MQKSDKAKSRKAIKQKTEKQKTESKKQKNEKSKKQKNRIAKNRIVKNKKAEEDITKRNQPENTYDLGIRFLTRIYKSLNDLYTVFIVFI